ncbi:hypothetical protein U3516DRAFT_654918 [Neocallimastix sp. 'constans']
MRYIDDKDIIKKINSQIICIYNIVYNIHSNGNKNLSLTNSIKEAVLNSFIDQCQSDVNTCKNRYFGDSDIEKESTKKNELNQRMAHVMTLKFENGSWEKDDEYEQREI